VIRREGARLFVAGPVNLSNVAQLLAEGEAQIRAGASEVDFGEVTELDSSLLAAALAWLREADQAARPLRFHRLPEGLLTMARLYGVADLLPAGAAAH
jgi:phospholipid transport system transporter-binding protein